MEITNTYTVDIHIPSVEEIYENIEKDNEKTIAKIVKEILGKDMH